MSIEGRPGQYPRIQPEVLLNLGVTLLEMSARNLTPEQVLNISVDEVTAVVIGTEHRTLTKAVQELKAREGGLSGGTLDLVNKADALLETFAPIASYYEQYIRP